MIKHLVEPAMLPARSIHLLGGAPFAGKSTISSQLIKAMITGESFLQGLTFTERHEPDQIGILFTDRPWEDNDLWSEKLNLQDVQRYAISDDESMATLMHKERENPIYGIKVFEECFKRFRDPGRIRFLIVDVLTNVFLGNSIHHAPGVHRHMVYLQQFCKRHDVTILGTCYGNKQKKGSSEQYARPVDRIIGASTLRDCASSLLFLTAPGESENTYQPFQWYSRRSGDMNFKLKRDPASGLLEETFEEDLPSGRGYEATRHLTHPMSKPDLVRTMTSAGVKRATAYRAIDDALQSGDIYEMDGLLRWLGGSLS